MNFIQGTVDVLILTALANGARHGYDVVEGLGSNPRRDRDRRRALYTSLHRMDRRGWLGHEWRVSPKGRRAKYYQLTREGRRQLRAGERGWQRFAGRP